MALTFDWSFNIGQVFTVVSAAGLGVYYVSKFRFQLDMATERLVTLQSSLDKIEHELMSAIKDNTLLGGTILVIQQRMTTAEGEITRARENIHKLANLMQARIREFDKD